MPTDMLSTLTATPLFAVGLTLAAYLLGNLIFKRLRNPLATRNSNRCVAISSGTCRDRAALFDLPTRGLMAHHFVRAGDRCLRHAALSTVAAHS